MGPGRLTFEGKGPPAGVEPRPLETLTPLNNQATAPQRRCRTCGQDGRRIHCTSLAGEEQAKTLSRRKDRRHENLSSIEAGVSIVAVGFCETPEVLVGLTRWVRMRLRSALWRQWKTPRRRRAALLALKVPARLAKDTASSGYGPWRLIQSRGICTGLSNAYFRSLGFPSLIDGC